MTAEDAGSSGYHKLRNTKALPSCGLVARWRASAPGGRGRGVPGCVSARGAGACGQTDSVYRAAAQEGDAEQSGAVDGEVSWGYRVGGP